MKKSQFDSSIASLEKVVVYSHQDDSLKMQSLYDLGGMYYGKGQFQKSYDNLSKLMKITPNFRAAAAGLDAAKKALGMNDGTASK
jgi:tetratricopeptide (TPR) repeat protein